MAILSCDKGAKIAAPIAGRTSKKTLLRFIIVNLFFYMVTILKSQWEKVKYFLIGLVRFVLFFALTFDIKEKKGNQTKDIKKDNA